MVETDVKVSGASGSDMSGREGSAWAESANVQQQVARQNLTRDCNWHALLWWHRQPKRRRRWGRAKAEGRKSVVLKSWHRVTHSMMRLD